MDVRLKAAVAAGLEGVNKSALCRELGISRDTLYRARDAFDAGGLAGLEPRSSRPRSSPGQISGDLEDLIVRTRKQLDEDGFDAGARSIHAWLSAAGHEELPHPSTIWRALTRRGLVVAEPKKRPKASLHRFEADRPNEMWQTDSTHSPLSDGTDVEVINVVDDHSRVAIESNAVPVCTASSVWAALSDGITEWGPPQRVLSDNGAPFVATLVTTNLEALGIARSHSRPYHPQTNGKVERFHQTQQQWLDARPTPHTLADLQALLDEHRHLYNTQRPHSSTGDRPPIERWQATPPATPIGVLATDTLSVHSLTVNADGMARPRHHGTRISIGLGTPWSHAQVTVFIQGLHAAVFAGDTLIRQLTIDPNRYYQPTGKPRGGPRRPPTP